MAIKTPILLKYLLLLYTVVLSASCDRKPDKTPSPQLELLSEIKLSIKEPSGLCYSMDKTAFYVVSDNTSKVYKISWTGIIISTLSYEGDDLEGITIDPNTGYIYVVEERKRDIVKLNSKGEEISRKYLNIEQNNTNKGLEGVSYNPKNNHIYILNEQNPGLLIELDEESNIIKQTELDFAIDYSGIFYEQTEDMLWIVSDKSRSINKCNLNGEKIAGYKIKESKAEGIIVDVDSKRIYVVLDGLDKMQIYKYN